MTNPIPHTVSTPLEKTVPMECGKSRSKKPFVVSLVSGVSFSKGRWDELINIWLVVWLPFYGKYWHLILGRILGIL